MSLSALNSPKHRLYMALENAATDAHPGYHVVDDEEGIHEVDAGTPSGKALEVVQGDSSARRRTDRAGFRQGNDGGLTHSTARQLFKAACDEALVASGG